MWIALFLSLPLFAIEPSANPGGEAEALHFVERAGRSRLHLGGVATEHATCARVVDLRSFPIPGGTGAAASWSEVAESGAVQRYAAVSLDGDRLDALRPSPATICLRRRTFDPLEATESELEPLLAGGGRVHIVQFETQPLEAYREVLRGLGVRFERYLAHDAHIATFDPGSRGELEVLPFVRWVGPYLPADRLEASLLAAALHGERGERRRVIVQVFRRGALQKERVAETIHAEGGSVDGLDSRGPFLRAELGPAGLRAVAAMDEVLWVDPIGEPVQLMNHARNLFGVERAETAFGFTGEGVRGEVTDSGVRLDHQEFQDPPLLLHTPVDTGSHGTSTTSQVFATGLNSRARGMLPDGQGIVGDFFKIGDPYVYHHELVDPAGPYRAVFQSNSWGWLPLGTDYSNRSAEVDDFIFETDLLITWGQGNEGNRTSLSEAWAKNVVSIGGFRHRNTLATDDDAWTGSGSIGPAADGRIKPDLVGFYDNVFAATSVGPGAYVPDFGGTSAATPMCAGAFGLFFQMWHEGVLGNAPAGATVFDSRPHCTTAKAALINSASSFDFGGPADDFARTHQGWGRPDLARLLERRDSLFVVDETDVLSNLESAIYKFQVGEPGRDFRATLCYLDVMGTPSSTRHRVNDLSLQVLSPSGEVYWGNNGLDLGNVSQAGGQPNTVDTVENVFIEDAEVGAWVVTVLAAEVNADTHLETPELDADFALVVSGHSPGRQIYCQASLAASCGAPRTTATGTPSATAPAGYRIEAGPVRGESAGILIYGISGAAELPFAGGTLCVGPPQRRSVVVRAGGTPGACDGLLSIDRNAFAQGLLGGNPAAFLLAPGTTVYSQWIGRDSSPSGVVLSQGVADVIGP